MNEVIIWPGKYLLGWANIRWIIKELIATWSSKPSYFSSKRIERCMAFNLAFLSLLSWFFINIRNLSSGEAIAVFAAMIGYGAYSMYTTQKEKKSQKDEPK